MAIIIAKDQAAFFSISPFDVLDFKSELISSISQLNVFLAERKTAEVQIFVDEFDRPVFYQTFLSNDTVFGSETAPAGTVNDVFTSSFNGFGFFDIALTPTTGVFFGYASEIDTGTFNRENEADGIGYKGRFNINAQGVLQSGTITEVGLVYGGHVVKLFGSGMPVDANGNVTGGVVTSVTVSTLKLNPLRDQDFEDYYLYDANEIPIADTVIYSATQLTLNAIDVVNASPSEVLGLINYSGNDSFTGTSFGEPISGLDGNDTINAGAGNDTLEGGAGIDVLNGGTGNDTYFVDIAKVGTGATATIKLQDTVTETATVADTQDAIVLTNNSGGTGNTPLSAAEFTATSTITLATNVEGLNANALTDFKLNITGNAGNNYIIGNNVANILDGAAGTDTLEGGAGDDTYIVDLKPLSIGTTNIISSDLQDRIIDSSGDSDTLKLRGAATFTNAATISLIDSFTDIENLDASLTGATKLNLIGSNANNYLTGNTANNALTGLDGNDTLDGGAGADNMDGGNGDDTFYVDNAGDIITDSDGIDNAVIKLASGTYVLAADSAIENISIGNTAALNLTGNGTANTLTGNAAANILDGGAGADNLNGGDGADTYFVDDLFDVVTETNATAAGGIDLVKSRLSNFRLGENLENLTLIDNARFGYGNALANTITGNDANNEFYGDAGKDTLKGGKGDDTYDVDLTKLGAGATATLALQDTIIENLNEGVDDTINLLNNYGGANNSPLLASEFITITTFTLAANIENLYAGFATDLRLNLIGNTLENQLDGNNTANILDGGAGEDVLQGGAGDDTYIVDLTSPFTQTSLLNGFNINNLQDDVIENSGEGNDTLKIRGTFSNTGPLDLYAGSYFTNVEGLDISLTGSAKINLNGDSQDNNLVGNAASNAIFDLSGGDDTLDGGAGADVLLGGIGNDTYVVDNIADNVTESSAEGDDTIRSSIAINLNSTVSATDLTLKYANIEHVTLTGAAAINVTGNDVNNILNGNAGANILDGNGGVDILVGGDGADTYNTDGDDTITETNALAAGGIDLVKSSRDFTLGNNLENLTIIDTIDNVGFFIVAEGNALANTIKGHSSNNALVGGAGKDTLIGGKGDDVYQVNLVKIGTGATATVGLEDTIVELAGTVEGARDRIYLANLAADTGFDPNGISTTTTLTLAANIETLEASDVNGFKLNLTGNTADNYLIGNDTANVLLGLTGNDTLVGGEGNDTLDGGAGFDTLEGGDGDDTYIVDLSAPYTQTNNNLDAGNYDFENLQDSVFEGEVGNDTLKIRGTFSNTSPLIIFVANSFNNVEGLDISLTGAARIDLIGDANDNNLVGNAGTNAIEGDDGNDTLDGGAGADSLIGGIGDDIYVVDNINDSVTEDAGEIAGFDTIRSSIAINLNATKYANVENVTLTGAAAINITGNDVGNKLIGNDGANIIDGGLGDDDMDGGKGADTYFVDSQFDEVSELLTQARGGGIDLVKSTASDYELDDNIENLTLLGTGNTNGAGNELANIIIGNIGNNIIDGDDGADKMTGGDGSDTYYVDSIGDVVTETNGLAAGGIDTVNSEISYILGANLENLTLIGNDNINGTGNTLINTITGNFGANILDGGASTTIVDTLIGGNGRDTYVVDITTTGVGDATQITIQDIVNEAGLQDVDTLKLRGTLGYTTVKTLTVTEFNGLTNVVGTIEGLDFSLTGLAKINLEGTIGNNNLVGNAFTNRIEGFAGDDTLNGGAGIDTLVGGAGNDTYVIDTLADIIDETGSNDTDDTVQSANLSLDLNNIKFNGIIENAGLLGATVLNLTGNAGDNELTGNAGANILDGKGGADDMDGGKGNDTYIVDSSGDVVEEDFTQLEGGGIDLVKANTSFMLSANIENLTLTDGTVATGSGAFNGTGNGLANIITGNAGDNQLYGDEGNDSLFGNAGNDILNGETGNDILNGGLGQDTFVFDLALNALTNKDTIQGFSHVDDTIQLSQAIFGSLALGTLNAGNYRVGTAALDANDFIINNAGNLYYDADGNGAGAAVQFASLTGTVGIIGVDDFVIV